MAKQTKLFHNNGTRELAPDNAKQRLAHFGATTTFYTVEYANGTYVEMWMDNEWYARWEVPAGQEPVDFFNKTVYSYCHGVSWLDGNNMLTEEEMAEDRVQIFVKENSPLNVWEVEKVALREMGLVQRNGRYLTVNKSSFNHVAYAISKAGAYWNTSQ